MLLLGLLSFALCTKAGRRSLLTVTLSTAVMMSASELSTI